MIEGEVDACGGQRSVERGTVAKLPRFVESVVVHGVGKSAGAGVAGVVVGGRGEREGAALHAACHEAENTAPLPRRSTAPSSTQLRLLRAIVRAMYDPRAPWVRRGKGMFRSATYAKTDVYQMRSFGERSFFFAHMLNFGDTVRELSDVGWLWFREFHLEMSRQVQFPIQINAKKEKLPAYIPRF